MLAHSPRHLCQRDGSRRATDVQIRVPADPWLQSPKIIAPARSRLKVRCAVGLDAPHNSEYETTPIRFRGLDEEWAQGRQRRLAIDWPTAGTSDAVSFPVLADLLQCGRGTRALLEKRNQVSEAGNRCNRQTEFLLHLLNRGKFSASAFLTV